MNVPVSIDSMTKPQLIVEYMKQREWIQKLLEDNQEYRGRMMFVHELAQVGMPRFFYPAARKALTKILAITTFAQPPAPEAALPKPEAQPLAQPEAAMDVAPAPESNKRFSKTYDNGKGPELKVVEEQKKEG